MSKKISPQQAFEAAKVFWPELTGIAKSEFGFCYTMADNRGTPATVDWPEGVDCWPMPELVKKWRDATIQDFLDEREARFGYEKGEWFLEGRISGYKRGGDCHWQSSHQGVWFSLCQVLDGASPAFADTVAMLEAANYPKRPV